MTAVAAALAVLLLFAEEFVLFATIAAAGVEVAAELALGADKVGVAVFEFAVVGVLLLLL